MLNLFEQFNISKNRLFENIADITPQSFNVPIDYCKINSILAGERKKSLHFLTKALGIEPNYKRIIIGGSWLPLYTRLKVNIIKDYSPVIKKVVSKLFH